MNKKLLLIFCSVLLVIAVALSTFLLINQDNTADDNISSNSNRNQAYKELEPVTFSHGSLNIAVDPRIELLTAVQEQAEYERLTQLNFSYKSDMNSHFKKYNNHDAVKTFKKMRNRGFSYDAPPTAMLYLSNPGTLVQKIDFTDYLISRAGNKYKLGNFVEELRDFSLESNFKLFYEENIPFYETLVNTVSADVKDMVLTEALDNYYSMEVNSYNIILSPLLHNGGYGPRVEAENGLYDVYGLLGPSNIIEQDGKTIPVFSADNINYLVWHEFSHSFVNPTTEKYRKEIYEYDKLFKKISSLMKEQAYDNWETCVNEHIVRAVTCRLTYLYLGQPEGEQALTMERSRGFYYIDALCESLEDYEKNRDTYPDFESYYPKLIEVFKNLSEQDLPDSFFDQDFIGPINSAFSFAKLKDLDVILITPTKEDNSDHQKKIQQYVEQIRDNFFQGCKIVEDKEALEMDLSDYIIIAYGTMEGNQWLSHYKDNFPFQINIDGIHTDKDYEGTDLRFISAMPNPQNYKNPLVIYTAQKSKDIIDINNVFHGPTDYIIADIDKEVHSGYYDKYKDQWTFPED